MALDVFCLVFMCSTGRSLSLERTSRGGTDMNI